MAWVVPSSLPGLTPKRLFCCPMWGSKGVRSQWVCSERVRSRLGLLYLAGGVVPGLAPVRRGAGVYLLWVLTYAFPPLFRCWIPFLPYKGKEGSVLGPVPSDVLAN